MAVNKYYGKYRAKVVDINDPEKRGRIRVMCPKILREYKSAWCEPCIPVAFDLGGDFALPKINEFVWIEFESGDVNKPIYTGGLWSKNMSPSESYNEKQRLITWGDCIIEMDEDSNTVKIAVGSSSIVVSEDSIELVSSSITKNGDSVATLSDLK